MAKLTANPTTKEIVKKYLIENGFDGLLCTEEGCGCTTNKLMACDTYNSDCVAAYKVPTHCGDCKFPCDACGDEGIDFCMALEKSEHVVSIGDIVNAMKPKNFREWYAFHGGEELGVPIETASKIWDAAINFERGKNGR